MGKINNNYHGRGSTGRRDPNSGGGNMGQNSGQGVS